MAQETALDWFFDNLNNHKIQSEHFGLYIQAKEIEKKQIIEAFLINYSHFVWETDNPEKEAEDYYNETYGNEEVL